MVTEQTQTQTQPQTQTVWKFDEAHTLIEFGVKHMMVSTVKGRFNEFEGTIVGDPSDPTSSRVEVTINPASLDTRNEQRDGHLKSPDFLDVENYPEITFKSTRIEEQDKNIYKVYGDLTIRGITKEIELEASINGVGKSPYGQHIVGITAETLLSREEWGLKWNVALESGGVLVGNTLKVSIEVEAVLQQ